MSSLYRDVPVFVDGRSDIYIAGGTVFKDYIDTIKIKSPDATLKKYGIETVLMPRGDPLTVYLEGRPGWENIYQDEVAVVFSKL